MGWMVRVEWEMECLGGICGLPDQGISEVNRHQPTSSPQSHSTTTMQKSPSALKNLFGSKKKQNLTTKENLWEANPLKTTPKFQLLGMCPVYSRVTWRRCEIMHFLQ